MNWATNYFLIHHILQTSPSMVKRIVYFEDLYRSYHLEQITLLEKQWTKFVELKGDFVDELNFLWQKLVFHSRISKLLTRSRIFTIYIIMWFVLKNFEIVDLTMWFFEIVIGIKEWEVDSARKSEGILINRMIIFNDFWSNFTLHQDTVFQ